MSPLRLPGPDLGRGGRQQPVLAVMPERVIAAVMRDVIRLQRLSDVR